MNVSHSNTDAWGSLYRLSFWLWGATLDWGTHRWVLTIKGRA